MAFVVYIITNTVNGKRYVGKTSEKRWNDRMSGHRTRGNGSRRSKIHRAIVKYGWESFSARPVYYSDSESAALAREMWFIKNLGTSDYGYNITRGGEGILGMKHSAETRKKMSATARRRISEDPGLGHRIADLAKSWRETISDTDRVKLNKVLSDAAKSRWANLDERRKMSERKRLPDTTIDEIVRLLSVGHSGRMVARELGVSEAVVSGVRTGKRQERLRV